MDENPGVFDRTLRALFVNSRKAFYFCLLNAELPSTLRFFLTRACPVTRFDLHILLLLALLTAPASTFAFLRYYLYDDSDNMNMNMNTINGDIDRSGEEDESEARNPPQTVLEQIQSRRKREKAIDQWDLQLRKQCERVLGEKASLSHGLVEGEAEFIRDIVCYGVWTLALRNISLSEQTKKHILDILELLDGLLDLSLLDDEMMTSRTVEDEMGLFCCRYISGDNVLSPR